jgi:hypothetical protein
MNYKMTKKLFFIYFIAHGLSLGFLNAQFYDDIILYNIDNEVLVNELSKLNEFLNYRVWTWLFLKELPGISLYVSYIVYFISSLLLYKIVSTYFFNTDTSYFFTVLYLILPFGITKFTLTILPYLFCLTFFLLGWFFLKKLRLFSLFFFFISFNVQSFLVLYCLPIISYYMLINKQRNKFLNINSLIYFIKSNLDLIVLPFIFFFIKKVYFKPSGYYADYNQKFELTNLLSKPYLQILDLFRNNLSIGALFMGILLSSFLYNFFFKNKIKLNYKINFYFVLVAFLSSLIPYWIVGATPTFSGYSSRHQILMLITFPFVFMYFVQFFKNQAYRKTIIIFFIAICFSMNIKIYFDYYIDYYKQLKIISFIKKNEKNFSGNNVIIMNDKYKNPSVTYSQFESMSRNAMFKRALNNEKNYVINFSQIQNYLNGEFDKNFNGFYLASDHMRQNLPRFIFLNVESKGNLDILIFFTELNKNNFK